MKKRSKNTKKMSEAPVGGQVQSPGSVKLGSGSGSAGDMSPQDMLSLVQSGALKVTADTVAKIFAPLLIPKDRSIKQQAKQTFDILNKARDKDAGGSSFLAAMQNMMNTPQWLSAGKKRDGKALKEHREMVRIEILRRKINEYFSKNPKAKTLIIKSTLSEGTEKFYYRIQREGKEYKITEVNTKSNRFIIEQGGETPVKDIPQDKEASADKEMDVDKDVSLDQDPPKEEPTDAEMSKAQPSPEERQLEKAFEGKPIEDISVEHHNEGSDLIIKTPESDIPSKLSFHRDGKVIFYYKDRPHVLKRA